MDRQWTRMRSIIIGAISSKLFYSPASSAILCGNTNPRAAMHQREYNAHTVNFYKNSSETAHNIYQFMQTVFNQKSVLHVYCWFGFLCVVFLYCACCISSCCMLLSPAICRASYVHIKQSHETF